MEFGGKYGFQHLPTATFQGFEKTHVKEQFVKWSLKDGLKVQKFSFITPFKTYLHEEFIQDFFACPAVTSTLEVATPMHNVFTTMGTPGEIVRFNEVKCSITSMKFFDKLFQNDSVVSKSGSIVLCNPKYFNPGKYFETRDGPLVEIEIADSLRKMILCSEIPKVKDDPYFETEDIEDIFSTEERQEFLYKLFGHLVCGGPLCQYEDNLNTYLDTVKILYKDLIGITGSSSEEGFCIASSVYRIHFVANTFGSGKNLLFHRQQFNNFFYLIVNPLKQTCFTFYHHV